MVTSLSATTVKEGSANKNQDSVTVQPISNLKCFQKHNVINLLPGHHVCFINVQALVYLSNITREGVL